MRMLECLKSSQRLLILSSFFWIIFSSCFSDWLFFASLCSISLILFLASSTILVFSYELFIISISVSFVSAWIFYMLLRFSLSSLSILITSVLNSASDRLVVSILFRSSFFWSFDLFFHLGHVSLSPHFGSPRVFVSMY